MRFSTKIFIWISYFFKSKGVDVYSKYPQVCLSVSKVIINNQSKVKWFTNKCDLWEYDLTTTNVLGICCQSIDNPMILSFIQSHPYFEIEIYQSMNQSKWENYNDSFKVAYSTITRLISNNDIVIINPIPPINHIDDISGKNGFFFKVPHCNPRTT